MPDMAALTVKKYDGSTDIVYDVLTKAAGDGSWAKWRQDTGNSNPFGGRPTLSFRTVESQKGIRRCDVMYVYPYTYTDSNTSQVVVSPLNVAFKNGVWSVPQGIPPTVVQEAAAQFSNLMAKADIKSALANQTAFT